MGIRNKDKMSREPRANARPDYFEVVGVVNVPTTADSPHAGTSWVQLSLTSSNTRREFSELPTVIEFNNHLYKKVTMGPNKDNTQEIAHFKKVSDSDLAKAVKMIYIDPQDLNTYPANLF